MNTRAIYSYNIIIFNHDIYFLCLRDSGSVPIIYLSNYKLNY